MSNRVCLHDARIVVAASSVLDVIVVPPWFYSTSLGRKALSSLSLQGPIDIENKNIRGGK
jgi:hypothetical protein